MPISRRELLRAAALTAAAIAGCGRGERDTPGDRLAAILERLATDMLQRMPELATSLAVSEQQAGGRYIDRLNDASKEGKRELATALRQRLRELEQIDAASLAGADSVSRAVVVTALRDNLASLAFEYGGGAVTPYVVTQLTGSYTRVPDFLDSQHPLEDANQAEAYLARLRAYARLLQQETDVLREDAAAGVVPPAFAIDGAATQLRQIVEQDAASTVLVASIARRAAEAAALSGQRSRLVEEAAVIVRDEVLPAYGRQIAALTELRARAVDDAGCWRLPRGEELYETALRYHTTTDLTADEIHEMGLELVRELNAEMEAVFRVEGLTQGSLGERYEALARRPGQQYPNTDAGRAALLADLNRQVAEARARMPDYFGTLAQAQLEIRRVPPYIEAGAPGGYYQVAALDGSRPGTYYINLRDTAELPRYTLPTLTYHEGIPGHHWQIAIQQEAEALPFVRSALLFFGAYTEGWALYAEQLADEMGMYANDAAGRLGYLQSMAFRASRLVVDTGMHRRRWSREQAIESMVAATGDQRSVITTEVERYAVWPGQACAYMVGRQAINAMRDAARATLAERFDIQAFHDVILTNGSAPLSVTEALVRAWSGERLAA